MKSRVLVPKHITENYLNFALISRETEFIETFQIKPYKDNSSVPL